MTGNSLQPDDLLALARVLRLPLILVDADGKLEAIAPRASSVLGFGADEVVGRELAALSADPEQATRFLRDCRRTGSLLPGSLTFPDENLVRCEGVRMPGPSAGGARIMLLLHAEAPEGFTVLQEKLEDLSKEIHLRRLIESEYRRLLLREKDARRAAEDADRMKDEFLAIVSHELRTPLNAVLSWTQILQMEGFEGRTADALERIARNARAQAELIDDLLDTSRIVSNQIGLEPREVVVGEVLNDAVETVRPLADAKRIRLALGGDTDARVEMDPARIRQVLSNLLENAVKFSAEEGRVSASVQLGEETVTFRVKDEGCGLRADELSYVFDRFRQVDQHSRRKHGGLGLGLAIAKQLVELHGGAIGAQSPGLDEGALFYFELPRRSVVPTTFDLDPSSSSEAPPSGEFLRRRRLLVVEDNDDARDALVRFLERFGADVSGVSSVASALAELQAEPTELILTDMQMPVEDGYDLLRRVRDDERFAALPVVALTAHARPEDREHALESGFDAYLAKPVAPAKLLSTLREICERTG